MYRTTRILCAKKFFFNTFDVYYFSALLSVQSIAKCQVAPPGDVGEIESLQREVSEFEERTRTFINTTESRLLALPVDGNMDDSSGLFIPVDGSTVGVEGSSLAGGNNPLINFAKGKVSTLECDNHEKRIVSKVSSYTTYEKSVGASMAQPSEKNVGASIAPPGEKSVHASLAPPGDCQEKSLPLNETVLRVVSTNDKAEYDVNTLNAVKTQMREMNCDVIDLTKITFLETECNRILEKFGLSDLLV